MPPRLRLLKPPLRAPRLRAETKDTTSLSDIIRVPFGYLLDWLYVFSSNYGVALILFSLIVKLVLLPMSIKSKKSMLKMSRLAPLARSIEAKYGDDRQKAQMAVQQMYKEEGVSMGGGCLWSFIPLLMGFGCNVPAIMACRTIESRSSRLITILITPFMSCSARIPIYLLLAGTFFAADASLVMIGLYVLGVVLAVVTARLMRRFMFPVDETPFVMELPPYRLPTWKTTLTHMWDKCAQYLRKMGGMILIASMVVWFLSYYPRSEEGGTTAHYENSYLGRLGQSCAPIFSPLGLNWKAGVALLSGVPAKEIVVSTLGVLYPDGGEAASAPGAGTTEIVTGSGEKIEIGNLPEGSIAIIGGADGQTAIRIAENTDAQVGTDTQAGKVAELAGEDEETVNLSRKLLASGDFTQASALAFLVFILLYFPCIATIAAIGAEAGWKWATAAVAYNTVLAWVVAWAVYHLFMWL